jgi:hypothetical protein
MDSSTVFKKTAKGQEAFAHRSPELSGALRSLLIMVDGKRRVADLSKVGAIFGDTQALLQELVVKQMIETSSSAPPAPALAPGRADAGADTLSILLEAAHTTAPAPAVLRSLTEARRFAVRTLTDALGPSAEVYCLKIETAKNNHDVLAAVQRAAAVLHEARGGGSAAVLLHGVELRLPP